MRGTSIEIIWSKYTGTPFLEGGRCFVQYFFVADNSQKTDHCIIKKRDRERICHIKYWKLRLKHWEASLKKGGEFTDFTALDDSQLLFYENPSSM